MAELSGFLVSPTEPALIKTMGFSSEFPEQVGSDVVWMTDRNGLAGVQRKTVSDLVGSVRNGLLGRELSVMCDRLKFRALVIEGTPSWSRDGELVDQYANWSRDQQAGVEWWAQSMGVWVMWTRDTAETVHRITHLSTWLDKEEHGSIMARTNPPRNEWGNLTHRATALHFLSGVPGIGVGLAGKIFDHFGRVPIRWDTTIEELRKVDGIGPKKAALLWKMLDVKLTDGAKAGVGS